VNNTQQFFKVFHRKHRSGFAPGGIAQAPHPSVFHKMQISNSLNTSDFHFYDFCRKFVPSLRFSLAWSKKRRSRARGFVTIGCLSVRG
jgi:hypothetical protein